MTVKPLLLLSYDYPPNDGGISRLCAATVAELLQRGVQVEVLTLQAGHSGGLQRPDSVLHEVPRKKLLRELATARMLLTKGRDSALLASIWNPEGTVAWLLRRRDLWVMAHGNEVMPYPRGALHAVKGWIRRRVLAHAQAVICNSRYTECLVNALQPSTRTCVINPGVDTVRFQVSDDVAACRARFGFSTGKRLVLSVSRMDAYKGHDVVLRAIAALPPNARAEVHYAVAGKGSHLPVLQTLAESLGVTKHVSWLGFVADADLPYLYKAADLFVLCTREDPQARGVEGFGMVFLEAQAAGLPVIGTRAGGIRDAIVEGEGGWLIEQDDVSTLADHLRCLVRDPLPYREQGQKGRRRTETSASWSAYVDALLKVMNEKQR